MRTKDMLIFLFLIRVCHSTPGCNEKNLENKSLCHQKWMHEKHLISALRCCLSYKRDTINVFEVPIIMLKTYTPFDIKCQRYPHEYTKRCTPHYKCLPKNLKDIEAFFNFLDLYKSIPKSSIMNKSSNWDCFNTHDDFDLKNYPLKHFPDKRLDRLVSLKKRLNGNFCRTLILDYISKIGIRYLQRDICQTYDGLALPFFRTRKPKRFSLFNPLKELSYPICMQNPLNEIECTYDAKFFMKQVDPIKIFTNFYQEWQQLGVLVNDDIKIVCGCFN